MKYQLLIVLVVTLFISATASAAVMETIFDASEDAYVDSVQTDSTFNNDTLRVQGFGSETPPEGPDLQSIQNSFLKFNVSSLEGKTIVGAYFGIYVSDFSSYFTPYMQLHYLNSDDWSQETLNWTNSQPVVATAAVIGTPEMVDGSHYYEWDVFSHWNNGDLEDAFAGYMLTISESTVDNFAAFPSSEFSSNQPYLRILYIPEPATLALLGLGTMILRKRRVQ